MRVVFAGSPGTAIPSLEALLASRHEVIAVLTRPDAPAGRGRHLAASPLAKAAAAAGLHVLKPEKAGDTAFLDALAELAPDCCAVVAYGALLPRSALDVPRRGWVNLHFSVLPAWRGAAPVQRAIMAGDEVTGATTFQIVAELDAGPIYGVMTERIAPTDTAGDLLVRLARGGARLLVDTLDGIDAGTLRPAPQPIDGISYARKITVADARLDWSAPAARVDRVIRGCSPTPGGWTTFRSQRLKILGAHPRADVDALAPGVVTAGRDLVCVGTATDPIELVDVQEQGRRRMSATDWARGARLETGERLV